MINSKSTLEEIVTANPKAADTFRARGLDFCCRGRRKLGEACAEAGLDVDAVLADLATAGAAEPAKTSWAGGTADEIIDHILERYHGPLRRELPPLIALARKVEQVHAAKPSRPIGLAEHLERVHAAVENHLDKEENILFPLLRSGAGAGALMPIQVMMQEHEDHGENLRRTRALTRDLVAPDEACPSWRELYGRLARLEADLFEHIHLENYVLFPRAAEGKVDAR